MTEGTGFWVLVAWNSAAVTPEGIIALGFFMWPKKQAVGSYLNFVVAAVSSFLDPVGLNSFHGCRN